MPTVDTKKIEKHRIKNTVSLPALHLCIFVQINAVKSILYGYYVSLTFIRKTCPCNI